MLRTKMWKLKNDDGFSALEVIVVILILSIIGLIGWQITKNSHEPKPDTTYFKIQPILTSLNKDIPDTYPLAKADISTWMAEMGKGFLLSNKENSFSISTEFFPVVNFGLNENTSHDSIGNPTVTPENFVANVNEVIKKTMESNGFSKSNETYKLLGSFVEGKKTNEIDSYVAFKKDDITCLNINNATFGYVSVTCFIQNDVVAAFKQASQFVTAYTSVKTNTQVTNLVFGPIQIKSQRPDGVINPSHAAGYDIAEAIVTNGDTKKVALFYDYKNGPWTYITEANDEYGFSCSAYTANATVRKVMYNQICLGENGQVRLDTNNRALQ